MQPQFILMSWQCAFEQLTLVFHLKFSFRAMDSEIDYAKGKEHSNYCNAESELKCPNGKKLEMDLDGFTRLGVVKPRSDETTSPLRPF